THRGFGFHAYEIRQYHSNNDIDDSMTSVSVHSYWTLELGVEVVDLLVHRDGWFDTLTHGRAMKVGVPNLDK
ncbi:hypothetical protein NGM37_09465, partial [Streptomyces sp. TRM76130]|nr:hypothetical protein [Streptomyces sp. TRM76130]